MTAREIIKKLNLIPLPQEGGYYRETFRSEHLIAAPYSNDNNKPERNLSTCIYYLLTSEVFSEFHSLPTEELFHFYCGSSVTFVILKGEGASIQTLGTNIKANEVPQLIIPKNTYFAAYLDKGSYALMGTTMSPGFDFNDYRSGNRDELIQLYPKAEDFIKMLTK